MISLLWNAALVEALRFESLCISKTASELCRHIGMRTERAGWCSKGPAFVREAHSQMLKLLRNCSISCDNKIERIVWIQRNPGKPHYFLENVSAKKKKKKKKPCLLILENMKQNWNKSKSVFLGLALFSFCCLHVFLFVTEHVGCVITRRGPENSRGGWAVVPVVEHIPTTCKTLRSSPGKRRKGKGC